MKPNLTGPERRERLQGDVTNGESAPLEMLFCTLKSVWGFWLLLTPGAFQVAPTLYRYVSEVPECLWAWAWLLTGIGQGTAYYWDVRWLRHAMGLVGTALWVIFGYLVWLGDHRSQSLVFCTVLGLWQALAAVWLYTPFRLRLPWNRN